MTPHASSARAAAPSRCWQSAARGGVAARGASPGSSSRNGSIAHRGRRTRSTQRLGRSDDGVFVRRIEDELARGRDRPRGAQPQGPADASSPRGWSSRPCPSAHDPRDAPALGRGLRRSTRLPAGARVGTASPRRRCQLLHARRDLRIVPLRGNVDTRVRSCAKGRFDALVLALRGVERLGIARRGAAASAVGCLPAVGQGALALEMRAERSCDARLAAPLEPIPQRAGTWAPSGRSCAAGRGLSRAGRPRMPASTRERLAIEAMVGRSRRASACCATRSAGRKQRREDSGSALARALARGRRGERSSLGRERRRSRVSGLAGKRVLLTASPYTAAVSPGPRARSVRRSRPGPRSAFEPPRIRSPRWRALSRRSGRYRWSSSPARSGVRASTSLCGTSRRSGSSRACRARGGGRPGDCRGATRCGDRASRSWRDGATREGCSTS